MNLISKCVIIIIDINMENRFRKLMHLGIVNLTLTEMPKPKL